MVWDLRLIGDPGGPASITGTARFMTTTFYIATNLLSGHTAESAIRNTGSDGAVTWRNPRPDQFLMATDALTRFNELIRWLWAGLRSPRRRRCAPVEDVPAVGRRRLALTPAGQPGTKPAGADRICGSAR